MWRQESAGDLQVHRYRSGHYTWLGWAIKAVAMLQPFAVTLYKGQGLEVVSKFPQCR